MNIRQATTGMLVVLNDRTDAAVYRVTKVGIPGWPLLLEIVDDNAPHVSPQIIDVSMAQPLSPIQRTVHELATSSTWSL